MKPRVHRLGSDKNGISGSASFPERKEILISGSCLAKTSAGLRPSEARGARWEHYAGRTLSVKQSVWRKHTTDPKTASSAKPVLVIEPLRELRTKLQQAEGNPVSGPILRGVKLKDSKPRPLDVNMLAKRGEASDPAGTPQPKNLPRPRSQAARVAGLLLIEARHRNTAHRDNPRCDGKPRGCCGIPASI